MNLGFRPFLSALAGLLFATAAFAQSPSVPIGPGFGGGGGSGSGQTFGYVYVATSNITGHNLKCDDVTDDTATLIALLQSIYSTGQAGTIYFPGTCLIAGNLGTFPNNSLGTLYSAPAIRFTSPVAGIQQPGGLASGVIKYAGALDMQYAGGTGDYQAKLNLRTFQLFELDHLTLMDNGSDCAPFVQDNSTVINFHDFNMVGSGAGYLTSCNDGFIFGGTGVTYNMTAASPFAGFKSSVTHVGFSRIRTVARYQVLAADIELSHAYVEDSGDDTTTTAVTACTNANPTVCTIGTENIPLGVTTVLNFSGFTGNWTPLNGPQTVTGIANGGSTVSIAVNATSFGALTGTPVYLSGAAVVLGASGYSAYANLIDDVHIEMPGYVYGIGCYSGCSAGNVFRNTQIWDPTANFTVGGYNIQGINNYIYDGHTDVTGAMNHGYYPSSTTVIAEYGGVNVTSLSIAGNPLTFNIPSGGVNGLIPYSTGAYTLGQTSTFVFNPNTGLGINNATPNETLDLYGPSFGATTPTYSFKVTGATSGYSDAVGIYAPNMTTGQEMYIPFGVDTSNYSFLGFFYFGNGSTSNYSVFGFQDIAAYGDGCIVIGTSTPSDCGAGNLKVINTVGTGGYTIAGTGAGTLAGISTVVIGMRAYVTDQLTACVAAGVALTGGGSVKCPVFYNGSAWVGD